MLAVLTLTVAAVSFSRYASAAPIRVIAVDFNSSVGTNYTRRLPELMVDELVNSGEFDVLERDKLRSVANELSFQAGALVDPRKAVEIGNMSGAQLMVTGNIIENKRSSKTATSYGITSTVTNHYLKVRAEVIELTTGSKLFSHIAEQSATLKSTGLNTVGEGEDSLGPAVARKLVAAMLENKRIQDLIAASSGGAAVPVSIRIESVPEGADVEIDGVFLGNAGNAFDVSPGVHQIDVTLPGHDRWSKQVKVSEGMSFTANLSKTVDARVEIKVEDAK